ncbi:hypothetical protein EDD66_101153 [Mobilisporobacter senegalensis]|uniref:Uncharacterized protein n=1 Tax=Mobilisporobacter senegalensis TaxID=1329262 RepID=A0A3N1XY45_9FIRM|nr:hypothetical protein [Mobilisporobacter senegalensis]ROR31536.1 hypothetical protein EDD66_101153 [Mobilisporobacter senegalensis]
MNVLIWGAGDGGLRTQTMLQSHIKVSAFMDIDKNKIRENTQWYSNYF